MVLGLIEARRPGHRRRLAGNIAHGTGHRRQVRRVVQLLREGDATAIVITSYSIHYTKLYDLYNCPDFASCTELRSYFNACPGDPSDLDHDGNGRPCESKCGRNNFV